MATPLQQWQTHRVDYRLPGSLALLLCLLMLRHLPVEWIREHWFTAPRLDKSPFVEILQTGDDRIQLIDIALPAAAPPESSSPAQIVVPIPDAVASPPLRDEAPALQRREDFSYSPLVPHRISDELLIRPPSDGDATSPKPNLDYLLSMSGTESLAWADTSYTTLALTNFVDLERQMFAKNAPRWAYEKAQEDFRIIWQKVILDNPLRGPP